MSCISLVNVRVRNRIFNAHCQVVPRRTLTMSQSPGYYRASWGPYVVPFQYCESSTEVRHRYDFGLFLGGSSAREVHQNCTVQSIWGSKQPVGCMVQAREHGWQCGYQMGDCSKQNSIQGLEHAWSELQNTTAAQRNTPASSTW